MLTGYFDESYTHPPASLVYTVGGYVSLDTQWEKFQQEWKDSLADAGISYFRMSKYESRIKEYEEWDNEKRIRVLERLHDIIKRRTLMGIAITVNTADYDQIITDDCRELFGSPHAFCVLGCMRRIAEWAIAHNYQERVAYVFERGSAHEIEVSKMFSYALSKNELTDYYKVGSWGYVDKRILSPLQAADILAYEVTKATSRFAGNDTARPVRNSLKNLVRVPFDDWWYYGRPELVEVVSFAKERGFL